MRILIGLLAAAGLVASGLAQESPEAGSNDADSRRNAEVAAKFAEEEARRFEIVPSGEKTPLELHEKSLLRWSNPTTAEVYGSVMLWTRDNRPQAIASIYNYFDRKQVNDEVVSLSEQPLIGKRSGKLRWQADEGVTFQDLADAPPPAETPEKRQLQMRSIARRFSALLSDQDDDDKFSELRLMSRPLYQYAAKGKGGEEGALFAFVTANDPEVLLWIESLPEKESRVWRYAAARLHFRRLQLKLGDAASGKLVWEVPRLAPPWEKLRGPKGTYIILEWKSIDEAAAD